MKIPNPDKVLIEREKLVGYLLNSQHPENGGKSQFFTQLGFDLNRWEEMANALRQLAKESDVLATSESEHGKKFVVVGKIHSPSGKSATLQSIWIIDKGGDVARLVTAYPRKG
jgi:hypothetical protein